MRQTQKVLAFLRWPNQHCMRRGTRNWDYELHYVVQYTTCRLRYATLPHALQTPVPTTFSLTHRTSLDSARLYLPNLMTPAAINF